jgi:adenylosuccinate lyase
LIPRYSLPDISKIWSDEYKYDLWRDIEVLYCEGLADVGLIPKKAAREIKARAKYDLKSVQRIEKKTRHDVIAFLTDMSSRIGPSGRYLHMGMTSSDLLDTTLACQMRAAGMLILRKLKKFRTVLKNQANRYRWTPMVGRTHGVHAEPITLGLKLLVWYAETARNVERLERAVEEISVGKMTGAVGTMTHVDYRVERHVMMKLGLQTDSITTQIIQRDRHAAFLSTLALIGSSLDKMATEIRALQRTEVGEVEEPFTRGQKGSSAMPHKKNPILCERVSGMARILRGNAQAAFENMPLWHERDISHSSVERVIIPDSTMILAYMLEKFTWVMANLKVNKKVMMGNLERTGGLIYSQHVLLLLVEKGMKREEAYSIVQSAAMQASKSKKSFKELLASNAKVGKICKEEEIEEAFDLYAHLGQVDFLFSRVLSRRGRPKKG